jgi:hypothetical protein
MDLILKLIKRALYSKCKELRPKHKVILYTTTEMVLTSTYGRENLTD